MLFPHAHCLLLQKLENYHVSLMVGACSSYRLQAQNQALTNASIATYKLCALEISAALAFEVECQKVPHVSGGQLQ